MRFSQLQLADIPRTLLLRANRGAAGETDTSNLETNSHYLIAPFSCLDIDIITQS